MKHTPGPWIVVDEKRISGSPCKTIRRADGKSAYDIAVIGDRMPSAAQWEPNARLIAAAPELLHALSALLFHAQNSNDSELKIKAMKLASRAIQNAQGGDV
jgi:hypothetical protein